MNETTRGKWAAFAVLLMMLGAGIAVVALAGSGGEDAGTLTLERYVVPGGTQPELLVSVSPDVNERGTAKGGDTVGLECSDGRGTRVMSARIDWPFIEEQGFPLPHYHQPSTNAELSKIATCRLTGTTIVLEGRLGLRR